MINREDDIPFVIVRVPEYQNTLKEAIILHDSFMSPPRSEVFVSTPLVSVFETRNCTVFVQSLV